MNGEAPSSVRRALGSRFLRESSTLSMGALFVAVSNLVGAVVMTHVLGAYELSIFYLGVSSYSLLWALLNLGLANVVTKRIAAAIRSGSEELIRGWMGVFVRLSVLLATVAFATGLLIFPFGAGLAFNEDSGRIAQLASALVLVPLLDVPRIVCSAALQGERRMSALARVDLGHELCRLILVVSGALIFGDAWGAVLGLLVSSFCGSLIAFDAYGRERRREGSLLPSLMGAARSTSIPARAALQEGVKVGLVRNVDSLGVQTLPTLILGSLGDPGWVAYLRIAQRLVSVARVIMQGINRTALPALSQLAGVKDVAGLRGTYWKASLLSGATITAGLLLSLPVLPFLISRLFPADFVQPLWTMILILTPGLCVVSFSVANDVFYLVTDQMGVAIRLSILGLVVNTAQVALFAWWLPTIGVAIGLTVTCLWSLVHLAYAWFWFRRHPQLQPATTR